MRLFACMVVALATACASAPAVRLASPTELSYAQLLAHGNAVASRWVQAHPPEALPWSWGEGVLAYGLWHFYRESRRDELREYLSRYEHAHEQAKVVATDDTLPALVAAELVLMGDASLRPLLDRVVAYIMQAPRTEAQSLLMHVDGRLLHRLAPRAWWPDVWVDSLFQVNLTLCRYSRISGDARYREEAVHQLIGFIRNLQDPATGLFTHAYNDRPRDQRVPSFEERAFWARGNGWALVSLVEVWRELPRDHLARKEIAAAARRLANALRSHVDPDSGLYHTVLLDPKSYLETAGSGLLIYGLARGAQSGLLDASYLETARRGMRGLVGVLEPHGDTLEVTGTSLPTRPNAGRYRRAAQRNQLSYGVGAWLLAASAILSAERAP